MCVVFHAFLPAKYEGSAINCLHLATAPSVSLTPRTVPSSLYNISATGSNTYNAVVQLLSGNCGTLSFVACANATTNGGTETITTSSLTANTTYRVRVYHAGAGAASGNFNVCVFVTPPPCATGYKPVNGTPVALSGDTLKWNKVAVATGYDVYFGTDSAQEAQELVGVRISTNQTDTIKLTGALASPRRPLRWMEWNTMTGR